MKPLRVGFIGYEGVQALDLVGASDAFSIATINDDKGQPRHCYEVVILGLTMEPFRAESGVLFQPHSTLGRAPALDTLIIPGGRGGRDRRINETVSRWIASHAARIRRIASVCTGIYMPAP